MRETFVPQDFEVPQRKEFGNYFVEPITTDMVDEDLKTLLANADMIVQLRGGSGSKDEWPYVCTREEDLKDLAWLEVCAGYKQLFSYVLRNNDDNSYAGCIYIYPIELFYPELADTYDVDFSFWITKKEYSRETYSDIYKSLLEWLGNEWPFDRERIYQRNKERPQL